MHQTLCVLCSLSVGFLSLLAAPGVWENRVLAGKEARCFRWSRFSTCFLDWDFDAGAVTSLLCLGGMASFEDSAPLYDAIVVGLGGHGSAALAHLSSAMSGGKVLGIERFEPAHGFGEPAEISPLFPSSAYLSTTASALASIILMVS